MFYLLGCALFAMAGLSALMIMAKDVHRYHGIMMRSLKTLSPDGWNPAVTERQELSALELNPAVLTMRPRAAVALARN